MKQKHSSRTAWDAIFKEKNTIACIEGDKLILPKNANILKAWYGVPDLQRGILCDYSEIKNGMIADNKNLGIQFDPVPGRVKILVVTYSGGGNVVGKCGNQQNGFACIEGYKLILPENINITKAWYGVPGIKGVSTNHDNIKNGMIVNNETMGINDPVPGKRKTLVVTYEGNYEKVVIVTSPILKLGVANNIKKHITQIFKNTVDVEIITEFPFENKDDYLYIFLYFYNIFDVDKYPDNYIVWQIEQLTSNNQKAWKMTQEKINVLDKAINIFEISMKNYDFNNYDSNIKRDKICYTPLPFYNEKNNISFNEKNIDCVFFGTPNIRRNNINNYLKKELNKHGITFQFLYSVFDKELTDVLKKTKYVINLHYYDKPCLEGARINIAIENNCLTISEDVFDDDRTRNLYKDYVIYNPCIKEDLSNIDIFIQSIIYNLKPEIYRKNIINFNKKEILSVRFENMLERSLSSCFIFPATNNSWEDANFKYFYNIDKKTDLKFLFKTNKKIAHRYKCFSKIPIIKNMIINNFGDTSNQLETILIEFRIFPHLEFLVRNTIIKLPNWNHTIVCGNNNFEFMVQMCENICNTDNKIKIIKLDIDNLLPSGYSQLLTSCDFWNNFTGEKLLIYQEDSVLFHKEIEPFLKFDYIGAPWPINQDDNSYGVGNGGFSLRSKSKMLKCIETVKPEDLKLGKSTLNYIKNTNSTFVPEDVYFSKTMIDYNIGVVARRDIAKEFSQETQLGVNPLGGHNYWLAANNKLNKSYTNTYKLCNNYYKKVTHRSGWGVIIKNLIKNKIISTNNETNDKSNVILVDCMEDYFLWGAESTDGLPIKDKWYGILHYTDELPHIFNGQTVSDVIRRANHSIQNCKGIIVLSDYLKKYIKHILPNIPVYMIKFPIEEIKSKFSLSNFIKNKNYNLIQLGLQYRKVSTIYKIKSEYHKIWLSGRKNKQYLLNILMKELNYLNDSITQESYTKVLTMFTQTVKEFDDLLLNNIVIIPLWNASANNAVLECLEMNIPVFITRVPAVEEYLGKEYPMFYTDISEVEKVINNIKLLHRKYKETYKYLLTIDRSDIRLEYFNSELLKIINT
jgi:hypothetical protein